jgi:hypothetical protein
MEVIVQDANNIIIDVDQGRAGRGISTVNLTTVGADYYLQFVYTDGTTEQVGPIATTVTELIYAEVRNAEAVTILKGQPVYLYQAQGNLATVKLAYNTSDATSAKTLGLAAENIAAGAQGLVLTQGTLSGIDTSAYAEGTTLYLGATPGTLTSVKPKAPNHLVYIGVVERANAGAGQIYVRVQNGFELEEIHDVQINSPVNGQTIIYDAATDLWKNANLTAGTGISITNGPGSITISAPETGTVTSVNASGGTTGLTFSGGPITSSGTLTLAGTLGTANGGTGLTSFTSGSVVYASSSSALATASAFIFNGTEAATVSGGYFSSTTAYLLKSGGSAGAQMRPLTSGVEGISFTNLAASTEYMRLTSTGLGIGTSSPARRLHVANLAPSTGIRVSGPTTDNNWAGGIEFYSDNGTTIASSITASTNGFIFTYNGSERMRLDSSGNLGIGTSSPSVRLDVQGGAINTSSWVSITPITATNNALYRSINTGGTFYSGIDSSVGGVTGTGYAGMLWHTGAYPILFGASNALRMTLTSAGNLGIGVTSPVQRLEVNGSMRTVAGSGGTVSVFESDAVRGNHCVLGADASGSFLNATFSTGGSTVLRFQTASTEQMRLTSTGLGIGTISPNVRLEVFQSANNTVRVGSAATSTAGIEFNANGGTYGSTGFLVQQTASQLGQILNFANQPITFGTNGSEKMRLDATGNLGLGATPSAWSGLGPALQLNRASVITGGSSAVDTYFTSNGFYDGTNWKYIGTATSTQYIQNASGDHRWRIASSGTAGDTITFTQAMTLNASGNLGIGTSSPAAKLESSVTSAGATAEVLRLSNPGAGVNTQAQINFYTTSTSYATITGGYGASAPQMTFNLPSATAGNYVWQITGTERMRLDSSGNLGIGTSSPSTKLTVFGGAKIGAGAATINATLMVNQPNGSATGIQLFQDGQESWIMEVPASSTALRWTASGTEQMRLTSTGLGIGAINPLFKLDARGASGTGISYIETTTGNANRIQLGATAGLGYINATAGIGSPSLQFQVADVEKMRLDASGNLGLGVTPSASTLPTIQTTWGIFTGNNQINIAQNAYYDSAWRYTATAAASLYFQDNGAHNWQIAGSGTAGNTISFTQAMTLDASGRLLVGATTATGARIDSQGTVAGEFSGLNITNLSTDVSATTALTIGAAGGNWVLTNTRTGASLISSCAGTERFRITNGGNQIDSQPAESAQNTSVTLTVANLQAQIITSNAAVTLTLPTGTSLEGYTTSMATNTAFECVFIATTANAITIAANGNTTVGNLTVSGNTSGTFRFRKTALNTFTVYRVS